jgi:hypothetical protein
MSQFQEEITSYLNLVLVLSLAYVASSFFFFLVTTTALQT